MDFRTKVPIAEGSPKIEHASGVFLIGSCFVENIGNKLDWFKFRNLQNPIGILFHPSPIRNFFQRMAASDEYKTQDVMEYDGSWQSLEAHSDMRRESPEACIHALNTALREGIEFIKSSSHLIISLGTAWSYVFKETNKIAANCHKIPQNNFKKEISSITEIVDDLETISHSVKKLNKDCKIIFTISPIRHLKDGFQENQQSKSHLFAALHQFLETDNQAGYFPSYEILMDELRDYRFYAEDMIHPNELAINYIWTLFSEKWMSEEALDLNLEIDKIQRALSHKPRAENSDAHRKFLTKLQSKIVEIHKKHPEITFS